MSPIRSSLLPAFTRAALALAAASTVGCAHPPPTSEPADPPAFTLDGALTPGGPVQRLVLRPGQATRLSPPDATPPDLRVDLITLGAVDAHGHPEGLGMLDAQLDLSGTASYAEVLARVAERHAELPPGVWLLGRGWDQEDWPDAPPGGWPLAADLDNRVGGRPVVLRRVDGHAAWVNSAAMPSFGAEDPVGEAVVRDPTGRPSGVLIDAAMERLSPPEPTLEERVRFLHAADRRITQTGLVAVHTMGVDDAWLEAWLEADRRGLLRARVMVYLSPGSEAAERLLREGPWSAGRVQVVGIKTFADGALGSSGAWLSADYSDRPGHRGFPLTDVNTLATLTERALRVRAQVAVHAIGDAGVRAALDAFARAREAVPEAREVPLRVEHAQVVAPEDWPRFAALNVVASMQPTHATSDMSWAEARLGADRVPWSYAWAGLRQAGALLAFGSDFPVEQVSPSYGIWAATTRQSPEGSPPGGWRPEQALTLAQTLEAFTEAPWLALGQPVPPLEQADLTAWRAVPRGEGVWWEAVGVVIDGEWIPADTL